MLPKAVLAIYSIVLLAAGGGALGYWIFSRWGARTRLPWWAFVAAAAVLCVLVFHPTDQALDELRMWLPAGARP